MSDNQRCYTKPMADKMKLKKTVTDEVALLTYVDEIIDEMRDPRITPADRPRMRAAMLDELRNDINTHIVNLLTEQEQIEMDKLFADKAPLSRIDEFMHEKIPNIDIETAAVMLNFKAGYLTRNESSKPMPEKKHEVEESNEIPEAPVMKMN